MTVTRYAKVTVIFVSTLYFTKFLNTVCRMPPLR